jgi:hypothetical protein
MNEPKPVAPPLTAGPVAPPLDEHRALATKLLNIVLGDLEWVRAQGGRHSVCPLCHAVCERDGGPGHADDCPRLDIAREFDALYPPDRARLGEALRGAARPPQPDRFEQVKALQKGWDGYSADPLNVAIVDRAKEFLQRVSVVPCVDGGVQLEWHTHGIDMELYFEADGKLRVYVAAVNETAEIDVETLEAARPPQPQFGGFLCADCKAPINTGEAKCFNVCDACWQKTYPTADRVTVGPPASPPALDPAVEAYQRERRQWFERAINGDNDARSKWLEEYEVDVREWLRDESAGPEAPRR